MKRAISHRNLVEGTVFGIPIGPGVYAVGVITRLGLVNAAFGAFFGPPRMVLPDEGDVQFLKSEDAELQLCFSTIGLTTGFWPIVGVLKCFTRSSWKLPLFSFGYGDNLCVLDDSTLEVTKLIPCSREESSEYPRHGWYQGGAVSIAIARKLGLDVLEIPSFKEWDGRQGPRGL